MASGGGRRKHNRNAKSCARYKSERRKELNKARKAKKQEAIKVKALEKKARRATIEKPAKDPYTFKKYEAIYWSNPLEMDLDPLNSATPKRYRTGIAPTSIRTEIIWATDGDWALRKARMNRRHGEKLKEVVRVNEQAA